jgi:hypothetical protein
MHKLEKIPVEQVKSLLYSKFGKPLYEKMADYVGLETGRRYTRQHIWGIINRKHSSYGRTVEAIIYKLIFDEEPKE